MPSLKLPVICELISRISLFTFISFFWNTENSAAISGTIRVTSAARDGFITNITIMAPKKYENCHTPSIRLHETSEPMREVSLITRA